MRKDEKIIDTRLSWTIAFASKRSLSLNGIRSMS